MSKLNDLRMGIFYMLLMRIMTLVPNDETDTWLWLRDIPRDDPQKEPDNA